jgi:tetratricopeptide (TPR) repeat protein
LIRDATVRDKLAKIVAGAVAAASFSAPAGGVSMALGGWGLIERLRARRSAEFDAVVRDLSDWLAAEQADRRDGRDAPALAGAEAALAQVVGSCALEPAQIVAARLDPDALAQAVLARAEAALPGVYADRDPRNSDAHEARTFLLRVVGATFAHLLANREFVERLAPDLWRGVFGAVDGVREAVDALPDAIRREVETAVARLRDELGARDRLILGFIRTATQKEVAPDQIEATLFDMAVEWREARGRADGGALANLTPDLSGLRAEAQAAHEADDVERFWTLLTELERREAAALEAVTTRRREIEAEQTALRAAHVGTKRRAIAAALARLDAEGAAVRIAGIVTLETPDPAARFAALRAAFKEWYARGRDKGLNLGLAVAIDLAGHALALAADADQRGEALTDLGNALGTLGEREAETARLEQAVDACREALEELTRDRVPLKWARTQMNLGDALLTLGQREAGTARLEQAVDACREALEELTRDRVPLDWARAQTNLGNALLTLGQREAGTARPEQAVDAFRKALEEVTRDRVPLYWGMTQMNLGSALRALGEREAGTERLEQAVDACREALKEVTRDRAPLDWAMTQMNLGNALLTLGEREAGTARLERAVDAYGKALEEHTRERVPLDWAIARGNQAVALAVLAERTGDAALAARAAAQLAEAVAVLRAGGHVAAARFFERRR